MSRERAAMRIEDLHARLLRHKYKEVVTMVKLGILVAKDNIEDQESEFSSWLARSRAGAREKKSTSLESSTISALSQSHSQSSTLAASSHGTPTPRKRYVAVLDTQNRFHVVNVIAPSNCQGMDPGLRTFKSMK